MTACETKKIIYETIVKEIYINPETAHALTEVIYKNLKDAEQSVHTDAANVCPECGEPFDFCAMGHYDVAKARRG